MAAMVGRRDVELEVRDAQFTRPTGPITGLPAPPGVTSFTTATSSSVEATSTSIDSSAATTTTQKTSQTSSIPSSSGASGIDSAAASSSTSVTAVPEVSHYENASGPPAGTIAAAVVVPALIVLFALAAFILIRRRKRRNGTASTPAMRESGVAPFITPMMMANTNTTYYTGLDTGSDGDASGEFYAPGRSDTSSYSEPPPPPYKARTHIPTSGESGEAPPIPGHPPVRMPTGMPSNPPSLDSWTTPEDGSHPDSSSGITPSVAVTSRSGSLAPTDRSMNSSDMYSDDASVHSARAARLSVPGAPVQEYDPFEDPESPVSSDDEARSFNSAQSRSVSPVSHGA